MRLSCLFAFLPLLVGCRSSETPTVKPLPYRYWESNSIQSNGIRLHYWRTDHRGKPVMIMAHGITDYGLNWATFASRFENDFDIIMYDARGHGFSEKPNGPYTLEAHMQDLVGLIGALAITKPILVGHSMGGSVVALTAATYPDLPAAILLEDPPMEEELEKLNRDILPEWKQWVTTMTVTPKSKLMELARTKAHPGWTEFEYDHWAESKRLVTPNVIDILEGSGFGNPREMFPRITVPTLILKADCEEKYRQRHLAAAALLPKGKLIHIKGAHHLIRNDKPDEMEKEIRAFLAR
ncbi:MAG: alpha/beta hydrolase [Sedimentisphaerales bacterium]|nr:alpha/beta hydrolase [Sedimentisphaerales bacterium]